MTKAFLLGLVLGGCPDTLLSDETRLRARDPDLAPPTVERISLGPLDARAPPEGVSLLPRIELSLSEPVDPASIGDDSVVLRGDGEPVEIDVALEDDDQRFVLEPLAPLVPRTQHLLVVAGTIRDLHGAPLSDATGAAGPFEYVFVTGDETAGPPRATLESPADGANDVPRNLREVVVVLSEPVTGDLHVGGHRARCDGQSRCVIPIRQPLEPDRRYEVDPSGLRDREGLAPRGRPSFRTGRSLDDRPPELGPTACAATEVVLGPGCAAVRDVSVTIRLHTDEPATAFVEGDGARVAGDEAAEDHRLRLEGLEPDRAVTLAIGATDAAGNEACARGLELRTLPALLPVVVTEVYADAAGPEPAQEFVEVLNVGTRDVSLDGLVVVDGGGPGDPVAAGATLAAGRYGLLVSDRFDATSAADPRLAPGTPLFRVGASLGTNGLLNAGEPVAIVDADGHELSRWPAFSAPRSGVSIQRVSPEADEGDPASWREDAEVGATPGAPSSTSAP